MVARRLTAVRTVWGVAVVLAVAAAFLLWGPLQRGTGQTPAVIDTALPADRTQCVPCHLRLGASDRPGLVFSHGNHMVFSCDACHSGVPHQGGATTAPPMETCFNCHGVSHGPQGDLATGKCSDCHTKSFKLRPISHSKDWAAKPHALRSGRNLSDDEARARAVNACMMCHDGAKDCDPCHVKKKLQVSKMPGTFRPIDYTEHDRPSVKIYPDGPTSMGQCLYCHPDVDDYVKGRVIFAHADHIRQNYQCTVCHPSFGHGPERIRRPDMMSCYRCHGLVHSAGGLKATEDCFACHPRDFELKPPDHTRKFVQGAHKTRAGKDPAYCAMCHKSDFCVDCHNGKPPKTSTASIKPGKKVVPDDHKKTTWRTRHGGRFLAREGSCGSCHEAAYCEECHKTPMPHPTDWLQSHPLTKGEDSSDCNVCHADRASCQKCHHATVGNSELIAKNCVKCHKEMRKKPATSIKHKAFAEHAVHFTAKKLNGRWHTCDDCHLGFGTAAHSTGSLKEAGHDVRLCYGCHGYLDYQNRLIAPYPGASLCLRCHSDLNI